MPIGRVFVRFLELNRDSRVYPVDSVDGLNHIHKFIQLEPVFS